MHSNSLGGNDDKLDGNFQEQRMTTSNLASDIPVALSSAKPTAHLLENAEIPSFTQTEYLFPGVESYPRYSEGGFSIAPVNNEHLASTSDSNQILSMNNANVYAEQKCHEESSPESSAEKVIPDESFELSPGKVALIQATEPIQLHIKVQRTVPDLLAGTGADEIDLKTNNANNMFSDTDSSQALEEANERLERKLLEVSEAEDEYASSQKKSVVNKLNEIDIIEISSSPTSDSNSLEFLDDLLKKPDSHILPGTENVDITFVQESLLDCVDEENADNINSSHDCSNDMAPDVDQKNQGNMSVADFEWLTERNEKRRRGRPRKARPIFNSTPSESKKPKRSNKRAKPKTRTSRARKPTASTSKQSKASYYTIVLILVCQFIFNLY